MGCMSACWRQHLAEHMPVAKYIVALWTLGLLYYVSPTHSTELSQSLFLSERGVRRERDGESFPPGTPTSLRPPASINNLWHQSHAQLFIQLLPENQSLNQWNDFGPFEGSAARFKLYSDSDIRRDNIILLPSADAAQQARDGARRWRLGDVWELPAETRPVSYAASVPGGGQAVPHQQQVPQHQGPEPRQLPGGGSPLPQQKVKTWDGNGPRVTERLEKNGSHYNIIKMKLIWPIVPSGVCVKHFILNEIKEDVEVLWPFRSLSRQFSKLNFIYIYMT